jgi:hypothetical protein
MDIEFHYYITCIIALRAGFPVEDALIISHASQYVDDNTDIFELDQGKAEAYSNYISQTSNITKPEKELMRIYPIFHFMPGTKAEIECESTMRRDGKFHVLNTVPDNSNAFSALKAAFESKNLYRIGIASHMFADTFAHQNFVGYYESFNSMKGLLEKTIPDVGHADAKHEPDWPAHVWTDKRLVSRNTEIDNRERFLIAAGRLFEEYRNYLNQAPDAKTVKADRESLVAEINKAIGDCDKDNRECKNRIARYKKAIGEGAKDYDENIWFKSAAEKNGILPAFLPWTTYTWKADFQESHWYKFQEAIKAHQWFVQDNILGPITKDLELERL